MAFEFGFFNEYSDSVTIADPVVAAVAKAIDLGAWVGKLYESMGAPSVTITQKAFDIYSRSKTTRSGVVGAGGWDADDTTDLPISSALAKCITKGTVLEVESEVVIVKSVDRTNSQIDVLKRGDAGTAASSHTADKAIKAIGYAGRDEDLKDVEGYNEQTSVYRNYVQTIFEIINWTKHGELVRKGLSTPQATAMLVKEAEIRVAEMLATMAVNGYKLDSSSGTTRYMSAGVFRQLADTNGGARNVLTYNVNGDLTEAKLFSAIKQVFAVGGSPDTIWCSPTVKDYINAFNASNSNLAVNADKADHGAGQYISHLDFEGNILNVRVDSAIPDGQVAVVKQGDLKKGWLVDDGLRLVDEPSLSSREMRKSLQGSVGFIVENVGINHILLTGITGGKTERVYKTYETRDWSRS